MKFKNIFVVILIFIIITIIWTNVASAGSINSEELEVTVDGVNFVLHPDSKLVKEENDMVIFEINSDIGGFLTNLETESDINKFIQENISNGYILKKANSEYRNGDLFIYYDVSSNTTGEFLIFQKENKKFIYEVVTDKINDNFTLDTMYYLINIFEDENDISKINISSGKSLSDCAQYFPEASKTVVKHIFDESDKEGDGFLSDDEFSNFKDLVSFTKKYAANIKNNDPVNTPDLWHGDGTTKTGYCADHGRVAVVDNNRCPYCQNLNLDSRTRSGSIKYV